MLWQQHQAAAVQLLVERCSNTAVIFDVHSCFVDSCLADTGACSAALAVPQSHAAAAHSHVELCEQHSQQPLPSAPSVAISITCPFAKCKRLQVTQGWRKPVINPKPYQQTQLQIRCVRYVVR